MFGFNCLEVDYIFDLVKVVLFFGGGESEVYKDFKEYVVCNFVFVGLGVRVFYGVIEFKLLLGDVIDVYFRIKKDWVGVEVKLLILGIVDLI